MRVLAGILVLSFAVASTSFAGMAVSRAGLHGAFPVGGDIGDGEGGFGAQVEIPVWQDVSAELSVTWSQEESDNRLFEPMVIEQELITIGVSALYRREIRGTGTYGLVGFSYSIPDAATAVQNVDIDMNGGLGFHAAVGLDLYTHADRWEIFVEYRYTYLELEGEWTAFTTTNDEDRDNSFGLAKLGVNYLF